MSKTKCFSRKSRQSVDFKLNTQIPDFTGIHANVNGTKTRENDDVKGANTNENDPEVQYDKSDEERSPRTRRNLEGKELNVTQDEDDDEGKAHPLLHRNPRRRHEHQHGQKQRR